MPSAQCCQLGTFIRQGNECLVNKMCTRHDYLGGMIIRKVRVHHFTRPVMVLTNKTFFGDHPPFLLPISTMVLTGHKIKRVPPPLY